jgi:hypothetical protein
MMYRFKMLEATTENVWPHPDRRLRLEQKSGDPGWSSLSLFRGKPGAGVREGSGTRVSCKKGTKSASIENKAGQIHPLI